MADSPASFDERFASLEQASRSLSLDVQGLNKTLIIVAELQKEQQVQRRRQDEADALIIATKTEHDEREHRLRRTFGGVSLALTVLLPLASIIVYWVLIDHVSDLLDNQKKGFFNSCTVRNQATRDNITRETALSAADPNPATRKIHNESAEALRKSIVDCSVYRK